MDVQQKVIVGALSAVLVCGIGYMAVSLYMAKDPQIVDAAIVQTYAEKLRVEIESGTVTITSESGDKKDVTTPTELSAQDTVAVSEGGMATIYWPDGSLSRLKGGAVLEIASVETDSNGVDVNTEIKIQQGEVWTKVMNMLSDNAEMTISTPGTVAGIRGTVVYHNVTPTREVIETYEHAVDVQIGAQAYLVGEQESLTLEKSEETLVTQGEVSGAPREFVTANRERDTAYEKFLSDRRATLASRDRDRYSLEYIQGQYEKYKTNKKLSPELAEKLALSMLDRLMLEIAHSKTNGDEEQMIKLMSTFDKVVNELQENMGDQMGDLLTKRIGLYSKLLLSANATSADLLLRQNFLEKKLAVLIAKEESQKVRRVLEKELFFAADLAKAGNKELARAYVQFVGGLELIQTPIFTGEMDGMLMEKIQKSLDNAGAWDPSMRPLLENKLFQIERSQFVEFGDAVESRDEEMMTALWDKLTPEQQASMIEKSALVRTVFADDPRVAAYEEEQKRLEEAKLEALKEAVENTDTTNTVKTSTTTTKTTAPTTTTKTTTSPTTTTTKTTTTTAPTTTTTAPKPTTTTSTAPTTTAPTTTTTTGTEGSVAPRPTYRGVVTPSN